MHSWEMQTEERHNGYHVCVRDEAKHIIEASCTVHLQERQPASIKVDKCQRSAFIRLAAVMCFISVLRVIMTSKLKVPSRSSYQSYFIHLVYPLFARVWRRIS